MSSNPPDLAIKALIERFRPNVVPYVGLKPDMDRNEFAIGYPARTLTLGEIVDCLAEAGLLVTPQASGAERDKEDLVQRISAQLADYFLNIGPNTQSLIASGQWKRMPLSVSERRDIAVIAAEEALRVMSDG